MVEIILEFKRPHTPGVEMYKRENELGTFYIVKWEVCGEWQKTLITSDERKAIQHFYYLVTIVTRNDKYITYKK